MISFGVYGDVRFLCPGNGYRHWQGRFIRAMGNLPAEGRGSAEYQGGRHTGHKDRPALWRHRLFFSHLNGDFRRFLDDIHQPAGRGVFCYDNVMSGYSGLHRFSPGGVVRHACWGVRGINTSQAQNQVQWLLREQTCILPSSRCHSSSLHSRNPLMQSRDFLRPSRFAMILTTYCVLPASRAVTEVPSVG